MSDKIKTSLDRVTNPFWLTNVMIRTVFRASVAATALSVRIPTAIALARRRAARRNRFIRW